MNNIDSNNHLCIMLQAVLANMPALINEKKMVLPLCGSMEKETDRQVLSLPAVAQAGALLNYGKEQIAQLRADLHCLYAHSLARFPQPHEVSEKLTAAMRLHRQLPEQEGILWQRLCELAEKSGFDDKDQLADCLVNWLFSTSRTLTLSASVQAHSDVVSP
ncbi:hypothetical protein [Morganella psychrotolerans]|uniref:hypothetical protein n=1 Tax=Morganella psychrotolerans TaxID=368603 RepID=UPI0039AF97A1